ncbi:putative signal transducing protein [Pedobacter sp. GR22-6]|uniref:putative signal transducing protein n=1 Tax=Pedobacter sp. GR22-6 TaxID=3127957 RepID=UPI00307F641C
MDKIVVFETYYNPIEASIIKERLIDSGIQCFLTDENTIAVNPLYNQALGGVRLHLFERDVAIARSILQDEDVQIPLAEEVAEFDETPIKIPDESRTEEVCPNCGSRDVGYVQATKNRFGIFTTVISILLMVYPFRAKKTHHCFNCEYEF